MNPNIESIDAKVRELHQCYCESVGPLPLTFSVSEGWERYLHAGFTIENLRLVLRYWRGRINTGMSVGVLRFSRLIRNHDTFSEDLCLAHAELKRSVPQTAKEKALRELRPTVTQTVSSANVKTGREAAIRALEQLKKDIA